jgi:hypothetical protein
MQHILRIIRISSKKWFQLLKEKAPYKCSELNKNIEVTNIFFKHISWHKKPRDIKEIIIRLWMINLIEDILLKWNISEKRENIKYEWKFFIKSYKIIYKLNWVIFKIVIWKKENNEYILLSCFAKILKQKKDYQVQQSKL